MFTRKKNVLVLGCNGMLGYDVYNSLKKDSAGKDSDIGIVIGIDVNDGFELHKPHALSDFLAQSVHFDYCINCVAHTDTKAAETTDAGKILDFQLNALAPRCIAESCKFRKTKLIHISTDYVFSEHCVGFTQYVKRVIDDTPFPTSTYGKNKLIGELAIKEVYGKDSKDYAILRVSWLYGMHNHKSFVHKFLKNVMQQVSTNPNPKVQVTENEFSIPTSTSHVVEVIRNVISNKKHGIFHAVPVTDNNGVSRYDFAEKILQCMADMPEYDNDVVDFDKVLLEPVHRDGLWPKYSAMRHSIAPYCYWDGCIKDFLRENCTEMREFLQLDKKSNKTELAEQ